MEPVCVKYSREFWVRVGITGGIFALIGLVTLSISRGRLSLIAVGVVPTLFYVTVMFVTNRKAIKLIDDEGVTRRDGKRLPWSEFKERRDVQSLSRYNQPMGLNNIDLIFASGKARLFIHVVENAGEILNTVNELAKPRVLPKDCKICTELRDEERAMQKAGREDEDTHLPAAAWQLKDIRELKPGATRSPVLKQCPECGTSYVYKETYEFLVYGSEDEQRLTRLKNDEEALRFES